MYKQQTKGYLIMLFSKAYYRVMCGDYSNSAVYNKLCNRVFTQFNCEIARRKNSGYIGSFGIYCSVDEFNRMIEFWKDHG